MNGQSPLTNLPDEWDPKGGDGSNLIWVREDLGTRSTPIVMDGLLYTLVRTDAGTPKDSEKLVCLNAATGETVWQQLFPVYLSDVPAERVGWSSVVGDPESGNVFALGVCGLFRCMDGKTGEIKWEHSLHEEYGLLSTYGGRTNFPIVFENNVIISAVVIGWGDMAKPAHRFITFDKRNGQPTWFTGTRLFPEDTTYSMPVLTSFNGQAAMVFGSGDGGYHAFQPRTGKTIWTYNVSGRGVNLTPLIVGDRVYGGHSEENLDSTEMGALFAVDGTLDGDITTRGEIWRTKELFVGRATPLLVDGKLYAIDDRAKLHVINPDTGEELGLERLGSVQRSSPLYADGKIYTITENGVWYTLKPNDEGGVDVVHKMRLKGSSDGSIIAADGHLFVPLSSGIYCVGFADAEPQGEPVEFVLSETPKSDDMTTAQVQIVPVEALLNPGQRQQYQVRLYNAAGQYLRLAKADEVTFKVDGPGEVSSDGIFESTSDPTAHVAATVTATVDGVDGKARVRVIPPLNWSFNFDDGQIPITWVGARYRHVPLDFDFWSSLNESDPQAASLYIFLQSGFVNFARKESTFDDTTPAQGWTSLLQFLDLAADKPKTIEEAQAKLGGSLQALVDAGYLSAVDWSTWERTVGEEKVAEVRLKVARGERQNDGNGVMCKITTIPKGARSQGWMGQPDLSDYTIQADVYGFNRDDTLPDIGLIGQRYTLTMMGEHQQLQIRTWTPQLRMAIDEPFAWEPYTWYTLKFQGTVEDGKAVLRGKVWKRDEEEPADWQIVGTDDPGQHQGSPGLFGDAKVSELFYDNLTVTKNASTGD
ncbi:MAG: PQQ-binding-like beta-propeller repeat protein [Planctomycetaceae bacterium]